MALPGVQTMIKDRFYTLTRTGIPVGPKVLTIAARETADGTGGVADYDAYRASNEATVINAFGEGSPAHRAYRELVDGGSARVYIVALPKGITDADIYATSDVTIAGDGVDHNHGAHNPFSRAFEAAESEQVDIIVPWGRGGHPSDWEQGATPSDVPFGFYADNDPIAGASMAKRVADRCKEISSRTHPVFAVLGVKPYTDSSAANGAMTATDLISHIAFNDLMDKNSTTRDLNGDFVGANNMYLSVVAAETRTVGYAEEWGYANTACLYAGAVSQLKSWSASTGKVIFNVSAIRYNPTRPQQETMISKGLVPVSLDFNRTPVWIDGLTFAKEGSDYVRHTTLRIVFDTINLVRNVAQGFIGEGATLQQRNALETAIAAALRSMQQAGAVLASDFTIQYVPSENKALVDISLTPAFEMRNIDISVAINL